MSIDQAVETIVTLRPDPVVQDDPELHATPRAAKEAAVITPIVDQRTPPSVPDAITPATPIATGSSQRRWRFTGTGGSGIGVMTAASSAALGVAWIPGSSWATGSGRSVTMVSTA